MQDANGSQFAYETSVSPVGYHWQQDGVEYQNGPFGPVNVYPHYGLQRD
jgi:hypothetical protein